jgi:hypothetical protein
VDKKRTHPKRKATTKKPVFPGAAVGGQSRLDDALPVNLDRRRQVQPHVLKGRTEVRQRPGR